MIVFHTADFHLDSSLKTRLNQNKAEKFNLNLTLTFQTICENALKQNAEVIIIAGDMFDSNQVSANILGRVKHLVEKYINIMFIYVYGNHDYNERNNIFKDFSKNFIVINRGESIVKQNVAFYSYSPDIPLLQQERFNIVIGHGDKVDTGSYEDGKISLKLLKNKNIDYLALGHNHSYCLGTLDQRGKYAYCGCPAGRGFDECGEKGYVKIDTSLNTITFEPLKNPLFIIETFDITDYKSTIELEEDIKDKLSYPSDSFIRVIIKGKVKKEEQTDFDYIKNIMEKKFFYFELKNETEIDYDELIGKGNISLKSEFLKVVKSHGDSLQQEIIEKGLKLLK